jgi:hypothetical protein
MSTAERPSEGHTARLLELVHEVNNLAARLHILEDFFIPNGVIDGLIEISGYLLLELERLKHEHQSTNHLQRVAVGGDERVAPADDSTRSEA